MRIQDAGPHSTQIEFAIFAQGSLSTRPLAAASDPAQDDNSKLKPRSLSGDLGFLPMRVTALRLAVARTVARGCGDAGGAEQASAQTAASASQSGQLQSCCSYPA